MKRIIINSLFIACATFALYIFDRNLELGDLHGTVFTLSGLYASGAIVVLNGVLVFTQQHQSQTSRWQILILSSVFFGGIMAAISVLGPLLFPEIFQSWT